MYDPKQKRSAASARPLHDALRLLSGDDWIAAFFAAGAAHAAHAPLQARLAGLLLLCANLAQRTTGGARVPGGLAASSACDAEAAASREALLCRCVDVFLDTHLALSALQPQQRAPPASADEGDAADEDGDSAPAADEDDEEDRFQARRARAAS